MNLEELISQLLEQMKQIAEPLAALSSQESISALQAPLLAVQAIKDEWQAQTQLLTTLIQRVNQMGEALGQTQQVMLADIERLRGLQQEWARMIGGAQEMYNQAAEMAQELGQIVAMITEANTDQQEQ